jgi:hypothetical protein
MPSDHAGLARDRDGQGQPLKLLVRSGDTVLGTHNIVWIKTAACSVGRAGQTIAPHPLRERFRRPATRLRISDMELLERAPALGELEEALAAARIGHGRGVIVGGGAGIGNTSVVRSSFLAALADVWVPETLRVPVDLQVRRRPRPSRIRRWR